MEMHPQVLPAMNKFAVFDLLATQVAVVNAQGDVLFANSALEDLLGSSRRSLIGSVLADIFAEPHVLKSALQGVRNNDFAALRYEATLQRPSIDPILVHVVVSPVELGGGDVLVQMLVLEQQSRQEREERLLDLATANKELIRNLAHEIKNPLGGIRGAAQLLQMEVQTKELTEYTQVIIHEADRLQTLVDRLLAPHRRPHVVSDVNIHEVFERVRSVLMVEFPQGLSVVRDYDTSIPEFRGDREQLIQAILNVAHNAAQVLTQRMETGDAKIVFKSRIARQITFGKQRYRLALELHVLDNGPGIPEAIKDRIFYPLVSGREGGSGLGLTLAQTFVQQHQGMIACDSVPGRTDFTILIPLP
jgi:two-component system, NtrC family, nitrogen regulation sensor histidine kinase GlnL